jgi:hypothetical protein
MSCCSCCVCIGGINYTKACSACGGNSLSASTVNANPSVSQTSGGAKGCGGASCAMQILNSIGKFGTAITGQAFTSSTTKAVAVTKANTTVATQGSTVAIFVVIAIALALIFILKK